VTTKQKLLIDTDPGVDDALALLMALRHPRAEVVGITVTAGNVGLTHTTRNALTLVERCGLEVPVFVGADRPLVWPAVDAAYVHGSDGFGDAGLEAPTRAAQSEHAVQAILRLSREYAGELTLVTLGPLTNLALALRKEPALAKRLGPVAVMGGARAEGGNITASAEFNIWADPDAAAEVLATGCDVILFGLDATHQVRATEARIAALEAAGTPMADAAASMMRFSQRVEREIVGWDAPPVHDPCPVAWLLQPALFDVRSCRIAVETESELTRGHTAVEFREGVAGSLPHRWAISADADGVFALIAGAVR